MRQEVTPLLRAAALELARLGGCVEGRIRVEVTGPDGAQLVFHHLLRCDQLDVSEGSPLPPKPEPGTCPACGQPADRPPVGVWLSGTEATIVAVVGRVWMTGDEIAVAAHLPASGHFRTLLGNLAERGVLESGRRGYRRASGEHQE